MIQHGFWQKLKKPIFVLAPMADVTDASFRFIIAKYSKYGGRDIGNGSKGSLPAHPRGGPDVMWTEFVSADGLVRASAEGKKKLLKDLEYAEIERPIVAQLFSSNPDHMREAAALCRTLGFDGIDINMGCPDKGVERQGAGAAMIKNPERARAVIRAAKEGAGDLPVSVKTRLGYNTNELEVWLPELLAENPAVITIHARTRKEMSKVPARWEEVKRAVAIRDSLNSETLIFGNGDTLDLADAKEKAEISGADGVMLGRAIFGNPWLFGEKPPAIEDRLKVLVEHTKLFEELLGEVKNFALMKKHFKSYVAGFPQSAELRTRLMKAENSREVETVVREFLGDNS